MHDKLHKNLKNQHDAHDINVLESLYAQFIKLFYSVNVQTSCEENKNFLLSQIGRSISFAETT